MRCTIFRKRPLYLPDDHSIDYQEEDPGRHPSGRAGQTDAEVAHKMCGNLCYDHSGKQLHHTAHHGEQAKAQPLHTIPIDIDRHERQEEGGNGLHIDVHQRNDAVQIVCDKQPRQLRAKEEHNDSDGNGVDGPHNSRRAKTLADTSDLARANVLGAVRRHGRAQGGIDLVDELLDFSCCGKGSDVKRSQAVQGTLDHQPTDGGDGELERHGQADTQLLFYNRGVRTEITPMHS